MMPDTASPSGPGRRLLALVGLSAFAILQPVLGKLADRAEFLVVHDAATVDLLVLVGVFALAPPLVLFAIEVLVGVIAPKRVGTLHATFVVMLLALAFLPIVAGLEGVPALLAFALACGSAVALAAAAGRLGALRSNLPWLALAAPAFAAIFLLGPGVRPLLLPAQPPGISGGAAASTPIVLLVFDALPAHALLDEDGRIDGVRYPNLRALADRAHWFPNALTESDSTVSVLPALVSGRRPEPDGQPTLAHHPENLFTLLGESHEVTAFESVTRLAPESAVQPSRASTPERLALLLSDTAVLSLHVLLPRAWTGGLPSIDTRWKGFSADVEEGAIDEPTESMEAEKIAPPDRVRHFEEFLGAMTSSERPPLFFLHTIYPHTPYQHYPSGQRYTVKRIEPSGQGHQWGRWGDDPVVVQQSQQRFLLQVGYVDRMVGRVLARLDALGLSDEALVVVTADHGNSFRPGDSRRAVSESNAGDILNVPLIIKLPHQEAGVVNELPVTIVDIMPTIADVVGLERHVAFDGRSVFGEKYRAAQQVKVRGVRGVRGENGERVFDIPDVLADRDESLQRRLSLFGFGDMPGLYRFGVHAALIGRSPLDFEQSSRPTISVRLAGPDRFDDVDPEAALLPGNLYGIVRSLGPETGEPHFAVSLNGTIVAVTRAFGLDDGTELRSWGALAPRAGFRSGRNTVEFWEVRGPADAPTLVALDRADAGVSYLGVNVGGRSVAGVGETGFWLHARWGDGWARWTKGVASLSVEIGDARPIAIQIALLSTGPKGAELRFKANGRVIFEGHAATGPWERTLSLGDVPMDAGEITLEIESSTFRPSDAIPGSKDARSLGVAVGTIVLL